MASANHSPELGSTALSEKDLTRAASAAAGFSFSVQGGELLTGGRINETWKVATSEGPLILRFSPKTRKVRQLDFELDVIEHLRARGCRVPEVIRSEEGRRLSLVGEHQACWTKSIETQERAEPIRLEELRELLLPIFAGLREFTAPFRPVAETRVFQEAFGRLEKQLAQAGDAARLREVQQAYRTLQDWETEAALPGGVIHADIYEENLLRDRRGDLWLIDFDDAHVGSRALDWTLTALEFAWEGDEFDEERFAKLNEAVTPDWAEDREREARDQLLFLLALKFASWEAALGTAPGDNKYLSLVARLFV